jgi:CheY-like chemotaxis protein
MTDVNQKRILVVDDEKDACEILKVTLERQGFHVALAFDGTQGLIKTIAYRPHCILLDIRMSPGDDGLTFLRKLRAFRDDDTDLQRDIRRTPVIIMTAASGGQMQSLFEQEGISGYTEKPYDTEVIKQLIQKAIG